MIIDLKLYITSLITKTIMESIKADVQKFELFNYFLTRVHFLCIYFQDDILTQKEIEEWAKLRKYGNIINKKSNFIFN